MPPPPPPSAAAAVLVDTSASSSSISPLIVLIIAIFAIVFFLSGLLIRCIPLLTAHSHHLSSTIDATALQGQLRQLFHLHDSGVDQSFIDALPVFLFRSIITSSINLLPFDCAVCLCEFEADDKLRLLPSCSHAFHIHCIDTWLLSHSTCPLCRSSLLIDHLDADDCCSLPFSHVGSGRLLDPNLHQPPDDGTDEGGGKNNPAAMAMPIHTREKDGDGDGEEEEEEDEDNEAAAEHRGGEEEMMPLKLGKYRSSSHMLGSGDDAISDQTKYSSIDDKRRCYSMGSLEYVMDDSSVLQVAIKKRARPQVLSECGDHSKTWQTAGSCKEKGMMVDGNWSIEMGSTYCCDHSSCTDAPATARVINDCGRGRTHSFARRTMFWVMGRSGHHIPNNKVGDLAV